MRKTINYVVNTINAKGEQTPVATTELSVEELAIMLWCNIKNSAERRGKDFNLTVADVKRLYKRKTCYYSGRAFGVDCERSMERIDNDKGYIKGNVVLVDKKLNALKANLSNADIIKMADKIKQWECKR